MENETFSVDSPWALPCIFSAFATSNANAGRGTAAMFGWKGQCHATFLSFQKLRKHDAL